MERRGAQPDRDLRPRRRRNRLLAQHEVDHLLTADPFPARAHQPGLLQALLDDLLGVPGKLLTLSDGVLHRAEVDGAATVDRAHPPPTFRPRGCGSRGSGANGDGPSCHPGILR